MERRDFMRVCAASAAAAAASWPALAESDAKPNFYGRARLVDTQGGPLRSRSLPINRNLIFHYPYTGTPCFLLNLDKPVKTGTTLRTADARTYAWQGGVGPNRTVVAYSAICAHKLTYPTREISFISYRDEKTPANRFAQVIHCCSDHSQFDPAEGGRVVAGPAPQPLAAILLEHDPRSDELYAIGTLGGEMFSDFFAKYEFRLAMEHGNRANTRVEGPCVVSELERFCRQQVKC